MICVLLNDSRAGAGWEVVLKDGDDWVFGRRCPDEAFARFVAHTLKQDHLKTGWIEADASD